MTPYPHAGRCYRAYQAQLSHEAECEEAACGLATVLACLASARSGEPVDQDKVRRAADRIAADMMLAAQPPSVAGLGRVRWG